MFGIDVSQIENKLKDELKNEKLRMLLGNANDLRAAIKNKPPEQAASEAKKLLERWEKILDDNQIKWR